MAELRAENLPTPAEFCILTIQHLNASTVALFSHFPSM
jgi:hypothetical protein